MAFNIDLSGRINNFNLNLKDYLYPLFEAISNSIHAIEDKEMDENEFEGKIEIEILRDGSTVDFDDEKYIPITGFSIKDNGVGLDEKNIKSFLTSDSSYKAERGGKGVGRFTWLKAVDNIKIESVYKDELALKKREFNFNLLGLPFDYIGKIDTTSKETFTKIILQDYHPPYKEKLSSNPEKKIREEIIKHWMVSFLNKKMPKIYVMGMDKKKIELNDEFNENFVIIESKKEDVEIEGRNFSLLHYKLGEKFVKENNLYLLANNRVVQVEKFTKELNDLSFYKYEDLGFYYIALVSSEELDKYVSASRDKFELPEEQDTLFELSMKKIIESLFKEIVKFLGDDIKMNNEKKLKKIEQYINSEAIEYRHLLVHMKEDLEKIPPTYEKEKLDDELYKLNRKFNKEVKKEYNKIMKKLEKTPQNGEEYFEEIERYVEKISLKSKSDLANYVSHRQVIINLLEKGLQIKSDDRYQRECYLHNLIYPMQTTSDTLPYNKHNLWLIDERLSYFYFISSDKPFNDNPKESRTDLLLLDNKVAFTDEASSTRDLSTVVICELKRPMRALANNDDPIKQVLDYIMELRTSKKSITGRQIRINENTQIYAYIICDIESTMERFILQNQLIKTANNDGYFRYYDITYKAYIEVISYDKLLEDSKKRNKVLFDILQN